MTYVWFDTGVEYMATRRHIRYLCDRYGIDIVRRTAMKPIPACCKEYGQPFLSKYVSEQMGRLQRHGFRWEDGELDDLAERYPGCVSALKWWTNGWTRTDRPGFFDIGRNRLLKEFVMSHPPTFRISAKCCDYAKKKVSGAFVREVGADLMVTGVRAAEGGVRAMQRGYRRSCVTPGSPDTYRPIYWWGPNERRAYCELFGIRHSECYETWGLKRTGCVGCPFGRDVVAELDVARAYEPGLVRVAERMFADSYEYTMMYREFRRQAGGQMSLGL